MPPERRHAILELVGVAAQVPWVVHSVVEHTDYEDARFVGLEEHAVAPTGRHVKAWPEVFAIAADDSACPEPLHDVAQVRHVSPSAIGSPSLLGIAPNRPEIFPGDLGEIEAPHNSVKNASIWSSFSSRITFPAPTSS